MSEVIVPDASVLLKWAFTSPDEDDSDKALSLLNSWLDGKIDIILPELWSFEVGNVLMIRRPETAPEIMSIFLEYNFSEMDTSVELCSTTFGLMKKYRVTFYDAVYHAVAILKKGTLLTAEGSYCKKVKDEENVVSLRNWNAG